MGLSSRSGSTAGVFTMPDLAVHVADPGVHHAPIWVFTMLRFRCSRWREIRNEGSGVTEGACKSLITSRTKRSGQRWRPRGISAVLALRSLLNSDRLERFWPIFAKSYTTTCAAA